MALVEFHYNGENTIIQCQEDQKMLEICNNYLKKSNINESEIYYFYDGKGGSQFDKNLTFYQMANSIDKERKKMDILVINNNEEIDKNKLIIKSKNIICPECGEDIRMKINNYKIDLFECKNNHYIKEISFNEFEKAQMINLLEIKCQICKETNKYNAYNNEFYRCYECNINICPLCKLNHNKNHNLINYDKIHYLCNKHNEPFTNYCTKCNKNICTLCEEDHLDHEMISLRKIMPNKKNLFKKLDDLKNSVNKCNSSIDKIINILNVMKENFNNYYKIEEYMINNYEQNERNFEILYNINEIINNNDNILNDLNKINSSNDIKNKFNNIYEIYRRKNNIIKMKLKIEKDDINKEIYFLNNTINNNVFNQNVNYLKELNDSNTELYINNKKYKYQKYFIPEKEGFYNILLKLNTTMTDCRFMFCCCNNIIEIDLSSFISINVKDMDCMFGRCNNLKSIDLTLFDTNNVTHMVGMFAECCKITNLDLSSFNTEKVVDMNAMFGICYNLENINLSSFNTKNVINMNQLFSYCTKIKYIDLSSFNTQNIISMNEIFKNCDALKEIRINNKFGEKLKSIIDQSKIKILSD